MRLLNPQELGEEEEEKENPQKKLRRKLLTLQEQKDAEVDDEKSRKRKLNNLNDALTRAVKTLVAFKDQSEKEIEHIKDDHGNLLASLGVKKGKLESEVFALEAKKQEALVPLDAVKKVLDIRESDLIRKEFDLLDKKNKLLLGEREVRELADKYEKRFGELKDFENELKSKKVELEEDRWRMKAQLKYRETSIENNHKKLRSYFEEENRKLDIKKQNVT